MDTWQIVVLIIIVIILLAAMIYKQRIDQARSIDSPSVEETLEQFALGIEADNKQLLSQVMLLKEQFEQQNSILQERIIQLENKLTDNLAEQAQTIENSPNTASIKDRYTALFELLEQGESIEFIAKEINMTKGEVQLIIQLSVGEEQAKTLKTL